MHVRLTQACPGLVHFIQLALNTRAGTEQSEVELLLEMCMKKTASPNPDWSAIEQAAAFANAPASKYSKVLVLLAKLQPVECIQDLSAFYKAWACPDDRQGPVRHMGSEWLYKLSTLNFGKVDKFPWVLSSAFKTNLTSADKQLVDGVCKLVTPTHLSQLATTANRTNVCKAEKLMTSARALVAKLQIGAADSAKCIGKLDVRLAMHLMKMHKQMDKPFNDIDHIGQVPVQENTHACNGGAAALST